MNFHDKTICYEKTVTQKGNIIQPVDKLGQNRLIIYMLAAEENVQ